MRKYNRYRFVHRWTTRVRREGGSHSVTLPKYIVRRLGLKTRDELLVKLTEDGILLRQLCFRPAPRD